MPSTAPLLTFVGDELIAANATIARRWQLRGGVLVATVLTDRVSGRDWLIPDSAQGLVPPNGAPNGPWQVTWEPGLEAQLPVEEPSLRGRLTVVGAEGTGWQLTVQVFADGPGVTCALEAVGRAGNHEEAIQVMATGVEGDGGTASADPSADLAEQLGFTGHHLHLIEIHLQDQTDVHDNLAWERRLRLSPAVFHSVRTCVVAVEDPLTRSGVLLVKHAPLPAVRPERGPIDIRAHDRTVRLVGTGYPWSVLVYRDGAWGRAAALHRWQRNLRAYVPARDGRLLSNTWGDRNRDGRIQEGFIAEEIAAGARLGVDVCQIDDGWQRGITANSVHKDQGGVWLGFYAADPQFWAPHPTRFPRGLAATATAARAAGIGLGLWFAPDSADDFAHWRKDADTVLELWRTHGVEHVKIDGVKAHTRRAEANLRAFFHAVLRESQGAVVFDLDITAEVRPGYFGAVEVGPLFVENRYSDWRRWWPHATLRNLWQLAWHIPPQRLRVEFLNAQRNQDKYAGDPLAPALYPPDYAFATTLVANPLGWFEVSSLPQAMASAVAAVAEVWKRHRADLHGGTILPLGECPDGTAWTGFVSVGHTGTGHLLAFRERTADAAHAFTVPRELAHDLPVSVLAGRGSGRWDGDRLRVAIGQQLDWVWLRLG